MSKAIIAAALAAIMAGCTTNRPIVRGFVENLPPGEYKCFIKCPGKEPAFWSGVIEVRKERKTPCFCRCQKGGAE